MVDIYSILNLLLGVIVGFLGTILLFRWKSRSFRKKHGIPNVLGNWHCKWFDDEGEPSKPKIEDTMEIQNWVREGEFIALGHQSQFNLSYPISGEIDSSRVVTLEYRAERYPYEPNRGVVCMILSRDETKMEGRWFGRRSSGNLGGGNVICSKMN